MTFPRRDINFSHFNITSAGIYYLRRLNLVGLVFASLGLLVTIGCESSRERRPESNLVDGRLHPTDENFPLITNERHVLTEDTTSVDLQLENGTDFQRARVSSIGISEGDYLEMIGSIHPRSMTATDSIFFYMDEEYGQVRVYDYLGSFIQAIGSPGVGPGEFTHVEGATASEDASRFFILDQYGNRVQIFQKNLEDIYELEHTFLTSGYMASDICVMGDHIFLTGYSEELDLVIHKLTLTGKYITSFGKPYIAKNSFIRRLLSEQAALACNEKKRVLAYTNVIVPVLRGYDESGSLIWNITFPDHNPIYNRETSRPSIQYPEQMAGESTFLFLATDPFSDSFVVSYNTAAPGDGPIESMTRHYFIIPVVTGEGAYLGSHDLGEERLRLNIPHINAWGKDYVYAEGGTFPEIDILDRNLIFK